MTEEAVVDELIARGADWSQDRYTRMQSWARAGWALAAVLMLLLVIGSIGGFAIWQKVAKPTPPVVIAVDHATGDAQALNEWTPQLESTIVLLQKFWVRQYVERREGYLFEQLNNDFATISDMSSGQAKESYLSLYGGADARHKALGPSQRWIAETKSIQLPPDSPGTAVVRFARNVIASNGSVTTGYYTARLTFNFYPQSGVMTERRLITNPLGFTVISYVVDAELHINSPASPVAGAPSSSGANVSADSTSAPVSQREEVSP